MLRDFHRSQLEKIPSYKVGKVESHDYALLNYIQHSKGNNTETIELGKEEALRNMKITNKKLHLFTPTYLSMLSKLLQKLDFVPTRKSNFVFQTISYVVDPCYWKLQIDSIQIFRYTILHHVDSAFHMAAYESALDADITPMSNGCNSDVVHFGKICNLICNKFGRLEIFPLHEALSTSNNALRPVSCEMWSSTPSSHEKNIQRVIHTFFPTA